MNDRILSLLSLATKAGKTVGGEMLVEKAVKEGKASLVIISSEASGNTRKKFTNMCSYYKVPLYIYATKEELKKETQNGRIEGQGGNLHENKKSRYHRSGACRCARCI